MSADRLPSPRKGQRMKARDVAKIGAAAEQGMNLAITGADQVGAGRQSQVQLPYASPTILVRITGEWEVVEPPEKPEAWAYCEAVRLQYAPQEGWVDRKPGSAVRIWHPTGYPDKTRDVFREEKAFIARFGAGDLVPVHWDAISGKWILVPHAEDELLVVLHETLVQCRTAKATIAAWTVEPEDPVRIDVSDLLGVVPNWRFAQQDDYGFYYAPAGTLALVRWFEVLGQWLVTHLSHCPSGSSVSESPSPPGSPSPSGSPSVSASPSPSESLSASPSPSESLSASPSPSAPSSVSPSPPPPTDCIRVVTDVYCSEEGDIVCEYAWIRAALCESPSSSSSGEG